MGLWEPGVGIPRSLSNQGRLPGRSGSSDGQGERAAKRGEMRNITRKFRIAQGDQKSQRMLGEELGGIGRAAHKQLCAIMVTTRFIRPGQLQADIEVRGKEQN